MEETLLSRAAELISEQRKKRRWARVFSSMAAAVVFCTTYALILPAITMEADPVCGMEVHAHGAECYENQGSGAELVCVPEDESTVLICEIPEHTHEMACYPEAEEGAERSEPEEPLLPANPAADIESPEDWEATFACVTLTGVYGEDVLAIADTQVGYRESRENYILDEEGNVYGYTRYGQWLDLPYEDWNIAFAAFCLAYAQVPEEMLPPAEGGAQWIAALEQQGLYCAADIYTPQAGDLVFFEQEDQPETVRAALVRTKNLDGTITIIEGDSREKDVRLSELVLTNSRILGYGLLSGGDGPSGEIPDTEIALEIPEEEVPLASFPSEAAEAVIAMIDQLPDPAVVEETLIACEEAEDWEGYEAALTDAALAGRNAYDAYEALSEEERSLVSNAEKLWELEWVWSAATFADTQTTLPAGAYGNYRFSYNEKKDAFIHDPAYADYYNEDSPLGTAGSFHLVAFDTANLGTHTNGNVLAHTLEAGSNFGTNNYEKELTYALHYTKINAGSASGTADHILVVGSKNMLSCSNNTEIHINSSKIDRPYNIMQDMDSDVAPFIDLDRVEREIEGISSRLATFRDANLRYSFSDQNNRYIELTDPGAVGVMNIKASELNNYQSNPLRIKGFESGQSGSVVINVDCSGVKNVYLPNEAKIWVDGEQQNTNEVTEFSAGKVVWNFLNAEGCTIETRLMTGMVVALGATVNINQNLNGTVVAENINVRAESHRTDFTGTIIPKSDLTGAYLRLLKVDMEDVAHLLPRAEFALYEWDGSKYVCIRQHLLTDETGELAVDDLKYNTAYRLVETTAPEGYLLRSTPYEFLIKNADTKKYPVKKPGNFAGEQVDAGHIKYFQNEKNETEIILKKKWQDENGKEIPPPVQQVSFTIYQQATDPKGNITTRPYGDPVVMTAEAGWVLTCSGLPREGKNAAGRRETYVYYVSESRVPGYLPEYTGNHTAGGTIRIVNSPGEAPGGYQLPETGGIGTQWYMLSSLLLLWGSGRLLYQKAKFRKEVT